MVARSFGVGEVRLEWGVEDIGHTPGIKMSPYSSDGSYKNALCLGNTWLVVQHTVLISGDIYECNWTQ